MITAIVFDLDGMIFLTESLFSEWLSEKYDIPLRELSEFFNNEFKECIIDNLDLKEELEKYSRKYRWKLGAKEIMGIWFEYGQIDNDMIALVKELREKGIICILCTNNEKYRITYLTQKHNFEDLFDYIFASSDTGYLKPDRRMFETIADVAAIEPSEILFCDDDFVNCKNAKEYGFVVHHYKKLDLFEKEIEALL